MSADLEGFVVELLPPWREPGDRGEDVDRIEQVEAGWRVDITNADVRDAKQRWLLAHDRGALDALVDLLYQDYLHLVSAQAQQLADELRRR